MRNTRYVES